MAAGRRLWKRRLEFLRGNEEGGIVTGTRLSENGNLFNGRKHLRRDLQSAALKTSLRPCAWLWLRHLDNA